VIIQQDVNYLSPERSEKLDLYIPEKGTHRPAVVIIHGGGWINGDKASGREFNIGTTLAAAGYVCASVNYRMAEKDRWPTNLLDCKNAVRFLRKNAEKYGIDADHIGVIGGSAGGHLALMVAYTSDLDDLEPMQPYPGVSDEVNCVVDLYGITDLLTRRKTDQQGNPIGPMFATTSALLPYEETRWSYASPAHHVHKYSPPTLIIHGTADTTVDRDQSKELDAKLTERGVEHQLIWLEGIGHTFDLQKWKGKPLPRDLRPVVIEFFDKHLKN
jgi:acetyl esterase/lipase